LSKKLKFNTSSKKERIKFLGKDSEFLPDDTHLEVYPSREITLDGCVGVLEFTDTYIKLNLKKGSVTVMGKSLDIKSFEGKTIVMGGSFSAVEFMGLE